MGLSECLSKYYHNDCLQTIFNQKIDITMFDNFQGIKPMGLSDYWADYRNKQLFTNIKT